MTAPHPSRRPSRASLGVATSQPHAVVHSSGPRPDNRDDRGKPTAVRAENLLTVADAHHGGEAVGRCRRQVATASNR